MAYNLIFKNQIFQKWLKRQKSGIVNCLLAWRLNWQYFFYVGKFVAHLPFSRQNHRVTRYIIPTDKVNKIGSEIYNCTGPFI